MDFRKVVERKKDLKTKDTDELVKIYNDNNIKEWSEEDFEAIRQILNERGQPVSQRKEASSPRPTVGSDLSRYEGVKGWLLLFCIAFTILVPLFIGYKVYLYYLTPAVEYFFHQQSLPLELVTISVIATVLSIGMILFYLIVGISLWTKKPGAARWATICLITSMIYVVIVAALPLVFGVANKLNLDEDPLKIFFIEVFREFIPISLWLIFLNNSKRVKATYRNINRKPGRSKSAALEKNQ